MLTALLVAAVATPSANAQQDEVFVDPESPAGTEYAVPLDQARREATGASAGGEAGTPSQGGEAQPLFGVGIQREPKRSAKSGHRRHAQSKPSQSATPTSDQRAAAVEAAAASDGSGCLLSAGIAAAVLAAGLLVGFGLRRALRDG